MTSTVQQVRPSAVSSDKTPLTLESITLPQLDDEIIHQAELAGSLGLWGSVCKLLFEGQCRQALKMGLRQVTIPEIIEMLIGKQHYRIDSPNHHMPFSGFETWPGRTPRLAHMGTMRKVDGSIINTLLPATTIHYGRRLFGFGGKKLFFASATKLVTPMPDGITTIHQHFAMMRHFSTFNVLAPEEHFEKPNAWSDPVLVATIYRQGYQKQDFNGQAHFFLAKWPD